MLKFGCFAVTFLFLAICSVGSANTFLNDDNNQGPMSYRRREIKSELAPPPLGTYSQAIISGPQYSHVHLSGTIPLKHDPATNKTELITGSIEEQATQVFTNMKHVAEAAGGSLDEVVKINIFLTDLDDFPVVNEVMGRFFKKPYPARSTVGVASLLKGVKIEIDGEMRH